MDSIADATDPNGVVTGLQLSVLSLLEAHQKRDFTAMDAADRDIYSRLRDPAFQNHLSNLLRAGISSHPSIIGRTNSWADNYMTVCGGIWGRDVDTPQFRDAIASFATYILGMKVEAAQIDADYQVGKGLSHP